MPRLSDITSMILYEDKHILVCIKPHGTATQSKSLRVPDMVTLLKKYLAQETVHSLPPYIAVIHRLDQPVTGILVFAKTPSAARELNRQIQAHEFGKYYRALLETPPQKDSGILENYLVRDPKTNTSRICGQTTPGARLARLKYHTVREGRIFETAAALPEVEVSLFTGRHHQIRVQFAAIGCPIVGDTKYNPNASSSTDHWQQICLCAYRLTFFHPETKKEMVFALDHFPTFLPK